MNKQTSVRPVIEAVCGRDPGSGAPFNDGIPVSQHAKPHGETANRGCLLVGCLVASLTKFREEFTS